jgi:RHS repeat-associated protein
LRVLKLRAGQVRSQIDSDGDEDFDSERLFAYDGNQIVLDFAGDAASDLAHRYLWGPAVDQILADESVASLTSAGDVLWPLTDHLNTTRDLAEYDSGTDTTTIASHRIFDSFGNLVSETDDTVTILLGFTARPFDTATGLQWNLNRWYISTLGVWMSEDPIGFAAGDANLMRYVGNWSVFLIDSNGLSSHEVYDGRPVVVSSTARISESLSFSILGNSPIAFFDLTISFKANEDGSIEEILDERDTRLRIFDGYADSVTDAFTVTDGVDGHGRKTKLVEWSGEVTESLGASLNGVAIGGIAGGLIGGGLGTIGGPPGSAAGAGTGASIGGPAGGGLGFIVGYAFDHSYHATFKNAYLVTNVGDCKLQVTRTATRYIRDAWYDSETLWSQWHYKLNSQIAHEAHGIFYSGPE